VADGMPMDILQPIIRVPGKHLQKAPKKKQRTKKRDAGFFLTPAKIRHKIIQQSVWKPHCRLLPFIKIPAPPPVVLLQGLLFAAYQK
jgi:hypothetical protein